MPHHDSRPRRAVWPGWFLAVTAINVLAMAMLSGARTLISYRAIDLGGDAVAIGIITGAFAITPLLIALSVGRATDRGHAVRVLRIGLVIATAAAVTAAFSADLIVLTLASAALGFGQIFYTVASQALIPLRSSSAEFDQRFSNLALAISIGQFAGYPIAGAVAEWSTPAGAAHVQSTAALLVLAVLSAVAVPLAFLIRSRDDVAARMTRAEQNDSKQSSFALLGQSGMKPAIFSSLTVLCAMDILAAYLPLVGQHAGLSVGFVTLLLTVRTLASVVSRALLPLLLRRVSRRALLIAATLGSGIPTIVIALTGLPAVLIGAIAIAGFLWGIGQPLSMSWVAVITEARNRGAALSLRLAGNRIGQTLIPLAAGALAGAAGPGAVFVLTGGLLLTSGAVTAHATRQNPLDDY